MPERVPRQITAVCRIDSNTISIINSHQRHQMIAGLEKTAFQQTEVGEIPINWAAIQLKDLIRLKSGFAFSSQFFSNAGPIILTPGNFNLEGGLYFEERNTKRFSGVYNKSMQFEYGDLLIVMTDLTPDCNLLGKPAFVEVREIVLHNQRIGKIELLNDDISKSYLYWIFLSRDYLNRIKETATGSTVRHTSNKSIYSTHIPLPPTLAEQTAIATALTDADALITQLEKLIAKKKAIKQGAMQELLKPKEGWEEKELRSCLKSKPDYGINAAATSFNKALPVYLRITDITEDGKYSRKNIVSVRNVSSYNYLLEKGDLVFARTGASVGKTYLYNPKDGKLVFAGFLIRVRVDPAILVPEYFQFYTQTYLYWNWIRSNSMRTGQPGINGNEYMELPIHLPNTIEEQTRIAQILSDMDAEIAKLEQQLDKQRMLKQGMMQVLLTGKIRLV